MNESHLTDELDVAQRNELGDIGRLEDQLNMYAVPAAPDAGPLLAKLKPIVPATHSGLQRDARRWLGLMWAQSTLFEAPFWIASALTFAIGLIVGFARGFAAIGFIYIAPILAALGVAYAFRPATRGLWELEKISPVNPIELLYARLMLVLLVNTVIAFGLMAVIWLQTPQIVLWRLILAWAGPMLALTGVALYTSIRWGAVIGIATPLIIWMSFVALSWRAIVISSSSIQLSTEQLLNTIDTQPDVLLGSVIALALGVWMLMRSTHMILHDGEMHPWN